jgi:hypothetical protein
MHTSPSGSPSTVKFSRNIQNRPMLAAMPHQIPLPVTIDVKPPRNMTALNGVFQIAV